MVIILDDGQKLRGKFLTFSIDTFAVFNYTAYWSYQHKAEK